jgi:hypothetical protein
MKASWSSTSGGNSKFSGIYMSVWDDFVRRRPEAEGWQVVIHDAADDNVPPDVELSNSSEVDRRASTWEAELSIDILLRLRELEEVQEKDGASTVASSDHAPSNSDQT